MRKGKIYKTSKVIDDLEGTFAVARLLDLAPSTISSYRHRKAFPASWYALMSAALLKSGKDIDPLLWSMRRAANRRKAGNGKAG